MSKWLIAGLSIMLLIALFGVIMGWRAQFPPNQSNLIEGTVLRQYSTIEQSGIEYYIEMAVEDKIGRVHKVKIEIDESAFSPYPPGCRAIIDLTDSHYRIVK